MPECRCNPSGNKGRLKPYLLLTGTFPTSESRKDTNSGALRMQNDTSEAGQVAAKKNLGRGNYLGVSSMISIQLLVL